MTAHLGSFPVKVAKWYGPKAVRVEEAPMPGKNESDTAGGEVGN